MDVTIDFPGGHGRLHFPGDSWPPLDVLADQAEAGAEVFRHCPDCHNVAVSDILTAMADAAPAALARDLRALASERYAADPVTSPAPEPDESGPTSAAAPVAGESGFVSPALTAAYELFHAAGLAGTDDTVAEAGR